MLSSLVLAAWVSVTCAPGWSEPVITIDMWRPDYHKKTLEVTETDQIHQVWGGFQNQTRIGYKSFLPDGTLLFPETMISNNIWSSYPTSTNMISDSAAAFWREGAPAWYCVRNSDGTEAVPTSLFVPDSYVIRPKVNASSDSLGRIHAAFETSAGVVYNVFEPGAGEIRRDTISLSREVGMVLVDGTRVHIVFIGSDWQPDYMQFDLEGNVVIPAVSLVEDLVWFSFNWNMDTDSNGDLYCLFKTGRAYIYISLFKIDGETGDVLIYDKEIYNPLYGTNDQTILVTPSGDSFYLLWREDMGDYPKYIRFALIDTNGDFIIEPYSAYDYSDEEIQNLQILRAATNEQGDIFAIWDQGDVEVGGYWIVLGWFDHEWLGTEEEETAAVQSSPGITADQNPFKESVVFRVFGDVIPSELRVFDITGRLVRSIDAAEDNMFFWDGTDGSGNELPSGTYRIQAEAEGQVVSTSAVKI